MCKKNPIKKYSMFSVMAHTGFGKILWKTAAGLLFVLPQRAVRKSDGIVKKAWKARLDRLSLDDCMWLCDRGAAVTTA